MSHKRSRSPQRYSDNRVRSNNTHSSNNYDRDEGGSRGPPPSHHRYNEGRERVDERRGERASSYYANEPHRQEYNYDDVGGVPRVLIPHHLQAWSVSDGTWQRGEERVHYDRPPYLNPRYNGGSDGRSDFTGRNSGGGRHGGSRQGSSSGGRALHSDRSEQQRVEVSSRFPNRLFLEEVDLPPEFAFRIDTTADQRLLEMEATRHAQKSSFIPSFYRDNLLGATEEYIKKNNILSYKTQDLEPEVIDIESEDSSMTSTPTQKRKVREDAGLLDKSIEYIVLHKKHKSKEKARESLIQRNEEKSVEEKREHFNVQTRQNPENIQLWQEFVDFQDEDCADFTKKARIGKKIAILETALRTNPKSSELHFDRLDLLNEISKSGDVAVEWEKLVSANQDAEVVWLERFKYSITQLQLFTSSSALLEFGSGFQKLRAMFNPSFPDYQKPNKLHLLSADLLFALCLILKSSGFTEKAVALHQAQLEFDFNFPHEQIKVKHDRSGWKAVLKLFELFWGLGTLRLGEPGYKMGWSAVLEMDTNFFTEKLASIGVEDSKVLEFEDAFFEIINNADADSCMTRKEWTLARSNKWVLIESLRSKVHWTPWRERISDMEECEDNQRIILPNEIQSFLTYVPPESYGSTFFQQAAQFRHVVNYLLVLSHDFLPRTHTVESILSPFSSIALSDSAVFFSELNYWGKFLNLYYTNPKASNAEIIPEGFQLSEFTLPSTSSIATPGKKLTIFPSFKETIETQKQNLLHENEKKYHTFIRNVVTQSIEHFEPKFASLLVQMLFRYEQKSMHTREENIKSIINFCKNLMKHEKLRSSVEAFGEIGLLEYFGGRKKKSINFLIKTVNSSCKILKEVDIESTSVGLFLEEHWETMSEVTKLYRLLAEFHLKDEPSTALSILVSLGNNFDLISLPTLPLTEKDVNSKPSSNAILKAKRFFESIMNVLVPLEDEEDGLIEIDCEEKNSPWLEKWDGEYCLEYFAQKSNLIVEWTVAYSLFAYLTDDTFDSASVIFRRVMDKLETIEKLTRSTKFSGLVVTAHHIREQVFMTWCKLGSLYVTQHPMQNAKFRTIFAKALEQFPSSPPLLLLYTTVESQCSVVGKIWRAMVNTIKQTSPTNICTLHWAPIFMSFGLGKKIDEIEQDSEIALDEFGIGGPAVPPDTMFYKLDAILAAAETNLLTRGCPLIWRLHLKHLAIRAREGKDDKRAHGLFYDAIRRCPTNKALYMDAIAYFPEMMKEINDIMGQKELAVRLPIEELDLLLHFNNQGEVAAKKKEKQQGRSSSLEDGETISEDEVGNGVEVVDYTKGKDSLLSKIPRKRRKNRLSVNKGKDSSTF